MGSTEKLSFAETDKNANWLFRSTRPTTQERNHNQGQWTNDEGQMTKDKWHWTKEKGQIETEQHEKVSVKPRRGISGGSDCKDSGSCLKSRFSISGFLRLFCSVFSVSFLDWVKPKGDDMPIPFLWMQRNQFLHQDPFKSPGWTSNLTFANGIWYVVKTKTGTLFSLPLVKSNEEGFLVCTLWDFGLWSWRF